MTKHNQQGWGLTETLLTLGAVSAIAAAVFVALGSSSASAQTKREQDNLRHLSTAVDRSWGLLGSFDGVSTARVLDDGLAPTRMRSGGDLRTAWGTGVSVNPFAVNVPGDAFVVSYPLAPSEVCARLASAMSRDAHDIRVEGRTVYAEGRLDPAIAAEQCGATEAASMEFVFHSGLVSGQAVAAAPVVLPPPPPTIAPPPGAPPVITIPGAPAVDPVNPGTPAMPPDAPEPVLPPLPYTPPTTPGSPPPPPSPPPALPPPPVSTPGAMCSPTPTPLSNGTTTRNCPVGQLGTIYESRTRTQHYTCPEAWGHPVPSHVSYGGWTVTSTTCAPECSAPAPSTESQTLDCPAGQLGSITQERTTTWSCPGPTGSPTSTTGGWVTTGNTCATPAPTCVAPPPERRPAPYTGACPAGWTGTHTNWMTYEARTWSCPSPTGAAVATPWAWDGTGGVFVDHGDCVPPAATCVVPTPNPQLQTETRTGSQELNCPAGQTGKIFQSRPEQRVGTRTASCPSPTGPVAWTPLTWGAWTGTGPWVETGRTCATPPAPTCTWTNTVYSLAPNWGTTDGQSVSYDDGSGGGCSASWGSRYGNNGNMGACRSMITPRPGASYSETEYTNWGGGMENYFAYEASCN